jgi:hypothetical protein
VQLCRYWISSLKDRQTTDEAVDARPKVLIVYAPLTGVHGNKGIANDVLQEWTGIDRAHDEAQRVGIGIAQHDEAVARDRFEEVQLVRRRAVADKRLVPARMKYNER